MKRIPVAGPSITQREIDYVTDAVETCWYGEANKYNAKFERAFADYVGAKHAVSLPSCTSAIHLSLAALGVGERDEVIVPDVTWIASAAPIHYVNATPVFADIDEATWCLSPESFENCITPKTKAVIAVDLYGNMPKMHEIIRIARRNQIAVIEDAAEAFGSEIGGQRAGSFGDTGVFSFHGSKTITTGEGGMLVTDNDDLFERVCFLRDHGRVPGDVSFRNREVAFKYKMSSMQAALGLAQVERAEEIVGRKREVFQWYSDDLSEYEGVSLNPEPVGTRNSYWMSTALVDSALGIGKEVLQQLLYDAGVDTRPFFHPLSAIPAFAEHPQAELAKVRNHCAYDIAMRGVNLPSGLNLSREDVSHVTAALKSIIDEHQRRQPRRAA